MRGTKRLFSWNEVIIAWNETTFLWNEVTWNETTMERNNRKVAKVYSYVALPS